MKVEVIKEEKKTEREYPYLAKAMSGLVVLFSKPNTGTVLSPDSAWNVGEYNKFWKESNFTPLEGKVILQND